MLSVILSGCLTFPAPTQPISTDAAVDAAGDSATDARCEDSDNDGYLAVGCASALPADCEDTDPARNPGALERCGNDMDENCDEADLPCGAHIEGNTVSGDSGHRVENGQIIAQFSETTGYLIESLQLKAPLVTQNLLHTTGDVDEKYIGVHMWPVAFQWQSPLPTVDVLATGPAVFRMRIRSTDNAPDGIRVDSHYTVFPDGRIHRDDHVTVQMDQSDRHLSGYVALDPQHFTHVTSSYDPNVVELPATAPSLLHHLNGSSEELSDWACAHNEPMGFMIGLSHRVSSATAHNGARVTQSQLGSNTEDEHLLSLIFDWYQSEAFTANTYRGDFIIYAGASQAVPNACTEMERLRAWLHGPAQLQLADQAQFYTGDADSDSDDNNDGYYEGGGFWAIRAGDPGEVAFTIDTGGGLYSPPARPAFRIHGLALNSETEIAHQPYIEINNAGQVHGEHYLWQTDPDPNDSGERVGWLYFHKPLNHGETIRIRLPR